MTIVSHAIQLYIRLWDGGDGPYLPIERAYLARHVPPGAVVADIGGGEGKLANELAVHARWVFLVDKEENTISDGDPTFYEDSLRRALKNRAGTNVVPVHADAIALPFADRVLDAVVSSQFLEHVSDAKKREFLAECWRVLKPGGVLALSTPNGDCIERRGFWLPRIARRLLPRAVITRLPTSMRGVWLESSLEQWEARVGHHGHGCRPDHIRAICSHLGFSEEDCRYLHTRLTTFWFQLVMTFPLLFILALPLARAMYALESRWRATDGVNLMIAFRKAAAA